jgi:hypothetical protein
MASNVLGGPNFDANLSSSDWKTYRNLVEQAVLSRFQLGMGMPPNTAPQYGIADLINPVNISASETTRPFLVTVSNSDSLQVSINPGTAITPSGSIVTSAGNATFVLSRVLANDINVVFVENRLIAGGTQILNDYQELLNSQEIQDPDSLSVALLQDFNNVTLFPPSRLQNIVVLSVVTVVTASGGSLELQIDMTQNTYSWNRPWFSLMDTQHRAAVGTGEVTTQNPHGTSFNDISTAGNVNLFQGLCDTGLVVSRDLDINKMTGAVRCTETVPNSRIFTDDAYGTITTGSPFGGAGAKYCTLLSYPTRLGSVYESGKPANAISAEMVPGTNVLVFGPGEGLSGKDVIVQYTQTNALLLPSVINSNLVQFGQPAAGELLVAGGLSYTTIPNPSVEFDGSGPFPRIYKVFMLAGASLVSYPQIISPAVRLDAINTAGYAPPVPFNAPARVRIGLTKATAYPDMSVQFTIYGKDAAGASLSPEVLTISVADGYVDESVPSTNFDSDAQSVVSANTYSSIDSIAIVRNNDGPQASIEVWAEIEAGTTPTQNDAMPVAKMYWNGMGVVKMEDLRPISKGFYRDTDRSLSATGRSLYDGVRFGHLLSGSTLTSPQYCLFTEDFENLHHFDTVLGKYAPTGSVGSIQIANNGLLVPGDTITVNTGKVLTAVSSITTPNPDIGQFQLGATTGQTLSSMLSAINNATFDSNTVGTQLDTVTVGLVLSSPIGSAGNLITVSALLSNAGALSLSGYADGYDAYSDSYLERGVLGVDSQFIPDPTNLNPNTYRYRNRYTSRAIGIPSGLVGNTEFAFVMHEEYPYSSSSLRIRHAEVSNPNQWSPWQVVAPITTPAGYKSLYSVLLTAPVHKIQIQYYGQARGISAYLINPN